jgi:holo-[acyl-carrier protein] synthase
MIIGLGTDITNVNRFTKLTSNERFIKRILTPTEIQNYFSTDVKKRANFLAKKFAGKEAFSKALGCGIGGAFLQKENIFTFQSIEILKKESGAPVINLLQNYLKNHITSSFISFSDEKEIVSCTVILC